MNYFSYPNYFIDYSNYFYYFRHFHRTLRIVHQWQRIKRVNALIHRFDKTWLADFVSIARFDSRRVI